MIPTTIGNEVFPIGVINICQILINHGKQAYVVGGSIRDIILSDKKPIDWDIATNATPKEVIEFFEKKFKVIPTGVKHGTVTILYNNLPIEVTTFRIDREYLDSRRPSRVDFVNEIRQDLARRDLTINAIAYDPIHNKFQDPFNGLEDIKNKIIRTVGHPDDRLEEDGLRLIRIFRFVSTLGFNIESETLKAIPNHFETFSKVSLERVHTEFQKLLSGNYWKRAIALLVDSGLMFCIFPEFKHDKMNDIIPNLDINRKTLTFMILENLSSEASLRLKYAVLLHQLSSVTKESREYFPRIDKRFIEEILKRQKFSNKQVFEITHILSTHLFPLHITSDSLDEQKDYMIRKLLFRVKREYLDDYLFFYQAKSVLLQKEDNFTSEILHEIRSRSKAQKPIEIRDLIISGDDIIQYFNIDKSQMSQRELIGLSLGIIRERVEFNPQINVKKEIYLILENLLKIVSQCKIGATREVRIVSTDHIRKLYCRNSPSYSSWESSHTYQLARWLVLCLLRKRKPSVVIFDGTNFNLPNHPNHRESLYYQFRKYKPLFINISATDEEVQKNLEYRELEEPSVKKSDANLTVYNRYKKILNSYPKALSVPKECELIQINTHNPDFRSKIKELIQMIRGNHNRLIIFSGNVLTGKTYTANVLQNNLERDMKQE